MRKNDEIFLSQFEWIVFDLSIRTVFVSEPVLYLNWKHLKAKMLRKISLHNVYEIVTMSKWGFCRIFVWNKKTEILNWWQIRIAWDNTQFCFVRSFPCSIFFLHTFFLYNFVFIHRPNNQNNTNRWFCRFRLPHRQTENTFHKSCNLFFVGRRQ